MEVITTAHRLELRTRVITQTITRPYTTITALVTLGVGDGDDAPTPEPTAPPPPPSPAAPPTDQQITPAAAPPSALSPSQLGAVLGSVLGLATLILIICCMVSLQRRKRRLEREQNDRAYYYYDDEEDEEEMRENGLRGRVRGTAGWNSRSGLSGGRGSWTTVPPPVRFPPTPRYTTYSQTTEQQIRGVSRYP